MLLFFQKKTKKAKIEDTNAAIFRFTKIHSKEWKNIKINSKETYESISKSKNRGKLKIHFNKIQEQLKDKVKLIFDDIINNI